MPLPELASAQSPATATPMQGWQRRRLFEALANALLSDHEPMLLVIDDLQWCDQETLEWLHYFMRYAPAAKILIIGTVRSEEVTRGQPLTRLLNELRHSGQLSELELPPLSAEEMENLVRQMTTAQYSTDALAQLYRETEGHPLFVIEMVQARNEAPTTDRPVARALDAVAPLPAKIQNLIATRLARLSTGAHNVAA